jgi:multicomponent Na+:H+ antiporter subunit G
MSWSTVADWAAAILLLAGALLTLAAGVGVLRFPDLLSRMHAGTKPQVLGLVLVLSAEALRARSLAVLGMLLVVVIFQFLTVPVAAHMVGRAGYRTDQIRRDLLVVDELGRDEVEAEAAALRREAGEPGTKDDGQP